MFNNPNRINQYKNVGRSGGIRDDLRKKCIDRIREKRLASHCLHRKLEDNIKNILEEILSSEISDWSVEDQIKMYDILEKDLLQDEYERELAIEEERLMSILDIDVFCPSCQKAVMNVSNAACSCQKCGFTFNFSSDPPNSETLSKIFCDAFEKHESSGCLAITIPVITGNELHFRCEMCNIDLHVV